MSNTKNGEFKVSGVRVIVQKRKNGSLDPADLKRGIRKLGYSEATGTYVFGLRGARRSKPWWIGRATRQGFGGECPSDHGMAKYRDALLKSKGTPILGLIRQGKMGRGRVNAKAIASLEKGLTPVAHAANRKLLNKYNLRAKPIAHVDSSLRVRGGRPRRDAALLRRMLKPEGRK